MYQPMKENVKEGDEVKKLVHKFDDEDKCVIVLDVRARTAKGNTLPHDIFHFVQKFWSTKEMIDTLIVAYEGTDEVKFVNKNNLNWWYEHFFQQKNETLTQVVNCFDCLVNDMCRLIWTRIEPPWFSSFLIH